MINKNALTIIIFGLLFSGCGLIYDITYSRNENCRITINKKYIKNSCGLSNGIQFEKLLVISKNSNGLPEEYYITERFDGNYHDQKSSPDKIYFNNANGKYKWQADTVNIHIKIGEFMERILFDSLQNKSINNHHLTGQKYDTCPVEFKNESWYYFFSPFSKNSSGYLFVDNKTNFHLYETTTIKNAKKTDDYDWTKIKEFKFYGFENPHDKKDAKYILADTSKIKYILLNSKRSDGFLPKGASRFATIIFDNKKKITIQIIAGGHLPFRVIKKDIFTDSWFDFEDNAATEWTNYINELTEKMEK